MTIPVTMGERGRITLPAATIERIGWQPGQPLRLTMEENGDLAIEAYPDKAQPKRR